MQRPLRFSFRVLTTLVVGVAFAGSAAAAPKKKKPAATGASSDAIAATPEPLSCAAPDEIEAGKEVVVECQREKWLADARIELFVRLTGKEGYTAIALENPDPKGPLRARIGGGDVNPPFVTYYVQANVAGAGVVAQNGRPDSPNLVRVKAPPPPPEPMGALAAPKSDAQESSFLPRWIATDWVPRTPGKLWVGLSLGSGYGWQSRSKLEYRSDLEANSGFGPAGLVHFAPEVGYQLTPEIAVSLAGRHQFISTGGGEPAYPGHAPHWAHSVLARGMYVVDRGPVGLYGAAQVGGGSGFRFRFSPDPVAGRPRHDTTRGGPVVFGPAAGLLYRLAGNFGLVAETSLLFGVPDFGLMTDINLGVQLNL
jgi:hypothetical protein